MGIRSLCAAAVVAVGVGQAEAAVYEVVFTLDSLSTSCMGGCGHFTEEKVNTFAGLRVGQSDRGILIADEAPDGSTVLLTLNYGANYTTNLFHQVLRHTGGGNYLFDALTDWPGNYWTTSVISWNGTSGWWHYYPDSPSFEQNSWVSFAVAPAPVPLPATAALLPLGIGALAMMRKRRKVS